MKKILLLVAVCSLIVIVFFNMLLISFNTRYAQTIARNIINAAIPGSITWDSLSISPYNGHILIHNAALSGPDGRMIISFKLLEASISIHDLFKGNLLVHKAVLDQPAVDFSIDRLGAFNLLSALGISLKKKNMIANRRPGLPEFLVFDSVTLKNGSARWRQPGAGIDIGIDNINLSSSLNFKDQSGDAELKSGPGVYISKENITRINALDATCRMKQGIINLSSAQLRTSRSWITIGGIMSDVFTAPRVDAESSFTLSLSELQNILMIREQMDGHVQGKISVKGPLNNPSVAIRCAAVDSTVSGTRLDLVSIDARMEDRFVTIPALGARAAGGSCVASGSIDFREAFPNGFLGRYQNPSAASYRLFLDLVRFPLRVIPVANGTIRGSINAKMSAIGTGFDSSSVSAAINAVASIEAFSWKEGLRPAPVSFQLYGLLDQNSIRIESLRAGIGNMQITGAGSMNRQNGRASASASLISTDLSREASAIGLPIGGSSKIDATLSGKFERPEISLRFIGNGLRYDDFILGDASLEASLGSDEMVNISRFSLANGSSTINMSGSSQLDRNKGLDFSVDRPLALDIRMFDIYLNDFKSDMQGHISIDGGIRGSFKKPVGDIRLSATGVDLGFQKFRSMKLSARMDGEKIVLNPVAIDFAPGESGRIDGWITTKGEYKGTLSVDNMSIGSNTFVKSAGIDGRLSVSIGGEGSLDDPNMTGIISVRNAQYRNQPLEDFMLHVSIADKKAAVKGKINFDCSGYYSFGNGNFQFSLLFNNTDISPYFSAAGYQNLKGIVSGEIAMKGNAARPLGMELSTNISRLDVSSDSRKLISTDSMVATVRDGVLSLPATTLKILDSGKIRLSGSGSLQHAVAIDSDGIVPVAIATWFSNDLSNASGYIRFRTSLRGNLSRPLLNAAITLQDVGLDVPVIASGLRGLSGSIRIAPGRITIDGVQGSMGNGTIGMKGFIGLKGLSLQDAMLQVNADRAGITIPDMLDMDFNARLSIAGSRERTIVRGDVTVLKGLYYQDVVLHPFKDIGTRKTEEIKPAPGKSLLDKVQLNVALINKNPFEIENNIARVTFNNNLRFLGTAAKPTLNGTLRVETGTLFYLGREFQINTGKVDFLNPYRTDPVVEIKGSARIQGWNVLVGLSGRPDALKFDLSSQPVLDSSDILSLILIGKTRGGKSSLPAGQLVSQAIALTYGDAIKKKTGIDSIEIRSGDDGGKTSSKQYSAVIGKSINDRITYYYSVGKDEHGVKSSTTIEYKVFDNILIDTIYDSTGKTGAEFKYQRSFR